MKKKLVSIVFGCAAILSISATNAFAAYPICSVDGCNETVEHIHDGVTYCGHSFDDGHDYHQLCYVDGCDQTQAHWHDEVCYVGCGHSGYTTSRGGHRGGGHHGGGHRGGCHR